jgi:hypothetical protein
MTFDEFRASLATGTEPPAGLSVPLRALWLDGKGDWAAAHGTVNDLETTDAARVHAYMHRKEGDLDNARYWYRRAGAPPSAESLESEWAVLVRALLAPE